MRARFTRMTITVRSSTHLFRDYGMKPPLVRCRQTEQVFFGVVGCHPSLVGLAARTVDLRVIQHAEGDVVNPGLMPPDELLERVAVTGLSAEHADSIGTLRKGIADAHNAVSCLNRLVADQLR
jgi:hypothetical protein